MFILKIVQVSILLFALAVITFIIFKAIAYLINVAKKSHLRPHNVYEVLTYYGGSIGVGHSSKLSLTDEVKVRGITTEATFVFSTSGIDTGVMELESLEAKVISKESITSQGDSSKSEGLESLTSKIVSFDTPPANLRFSKPWRKDIEATLKDSLYQMRQDSRYKKMMENDKYVKAFKKKKLLYKGLK